MTSERVFRAVERLRRGFIDEPTPVAEKGLEGAYLMLQEIFTAIEPPERWELPDRWAEFRRKVNGGPSPIEAAFDARVKEDAAPLEQRQRAEWRGVNSAGDKYEVRG